MKNTLIILICFISVNFFGQKRELGKVTVDELKQKNHGTDSSAVAAIMFKVGDVIFDYTQQDGFFINTTIRTKIKIYKKEGYDWANFEMLLYNEASAKQTLEIKSAYTYNLVGDKIEKTKLKSEGEFNEKVNKYWSKKKITMPNVKEGSIIEIEYTIKDEGTGLIDEWTFQDQIPVDYSEYNTYIPEYYVYNPYFRGWLAPKITKEDFRKTIELRNRESEGNSRMYTTVNVSEVSYILKKTSYILV